MSSFVIQGPALLVANYTSIHEVCELTSVLTFEGDFVISDFAFHLYYPNHCLSVFRVDVQISGYVDTEELFFRVVAQHSHKSCIGREGFTLRTVLEYPFAQVSKEMFEPGFGSLQSFLRLLTFSYIVHNGDASSNVTFPIIFCDG